MPAPYEITVTHLLRLVGTPDAPIILDLRTDEDFNDDPRLIPGAFRYAYTQIALIAPQLAGQQVTVYCQKGRKISQGAAAILRAEGIEAEVLMGGHFAWRDAVAPMVDANALPVRDSQGRTVWVTRHRPKIDRIACPWFIRRFVDTKAVFLFVPPTDVELVAERFSATPFDIEGEGIRFTHNGDNCSLDSMIETFGVRLGALDQVAQIIRGADTNRLDLAPEAAGVLAVSLGLSRMFRDDNAQLDAGMLIYDALFRWARDAADETHDWPHSAKHKASA